MINFEKQIVIESEAIASAGDSVAALRKLKTLPLESWGALLWEMPSLEFPSLSKMLPTMSSEEVQKKWTGQSGNALLQQSLPFVRYLKSVYQNDIQDISQSNSRVLDYGCGYGRLSRLMLKYLNFEDLYGADPWPESIAEAHSAGFVKNYVLTEEVPFELPFELESFSLIWAFSVFTHLAPNVAQDSLRTLSRYLSKDGVLVITIRPIEIWDTRSNLEEQVLKMLRESHENTGFAFLAHNRPPSSTHGITYGDTSMTLNYLQSITKDFKIVEVDRLSIDPCQIYVTLKKT